jgi:DNA-directed RNA polymerase subunit beta'
MPTLLNYNNFCNDLEEVTSLKIFGKKKFHPDGLFSEQIFGPVKNYTCQCGTYYGLSKSGGKCSECNVDIVNSDERRKRFAKITLPIPVVNPLFYDLLCEVGGKVFKESIDKLMKNEKSLMFIHGEEHVFRNDISDIPKGTKVFERTDAIYKLVYDFSEKFAKEGIEEWEYIYKHIDNLLINYVIVLPPNLRPLSSSGGGKHLMDKINRYYVQILTKKEIMQNTILDVLRDKKLYYTYFKQLQKDVNELYDRILEKIAKKEGLIRGSILGKRIDFSGRAVIIPDPTLDLDECVLPYAMILEIYKLNIAKRIIETGKFKLLNDAIDFVERCIKLNSPILLNVCEDMITDEVCILNRQPSLHKLGMLGFKIKMDLDTGCLDKVIRIHPLVCAPFNADFDGDQMAVYIPISNEAKQEIREKISIVKNLYSPSNEDLTTTPNQDIVLGIYFITSELFSDPKKGFEIFNQCLPKDYPEIKEVVNKKKLMEILNDIKDKYPDEVTVKVLDNIKRVGFKYATLFGCTLSLDDFYIPESKEFRDSLYKGKIQDQLISISDPKIVDFLKNNFKYSYMIESGARGSWDQAKQMLLTRGFISNFDGEILPLPIKQSLVEGLDEEEFFYSTYGCRKGLLDVALNTGISGYLSRKLIFTCANLQIDEALEDCGTSDFLEVNVKNERKAKMLINRFYLNNDKLELITKENYKDLVKKIILIRSPILCKSANICCTCYGNLFKRLNSKFIGIIAAQTLGERATQLVLRTFHTSGSAKIHGETKNNVGMKQQDIIGDLAEVSKLLHKFEEKDYVKITERLFDVYDKDIHHVHFECVVAQLMWSESKKWRLLPNRDTIKPDYYSVQSVPNKESWILSMAFSNPKKSILQGILHGGRYSGIIDKILKGESIS